jgi:hypothetical protein
LKFEAFMALLEGCFDDRPADKRPGLPFGPLSVYHLASFEPAPGHGLVRGLVPSVPLW